MTDDIAFQNFTEARLQRARNRNAQKGGQQPFALHDDAPSKPSSSQAFDPALEHQKDLHIARKKRQILLLENQLALAQVTEASPTGRMSVQARVKLQDEARWQQQEDLKKAEFKRQSVRLLKKVADGQVAKEQDEKAILEKPAQRFPVKTVGSSVLPTSEIVKRPRPASAFTSRADARKAANTGGPLRADGSDRFRFTPNMPHSDLLPAGGCFKFDDGGHTRPKSSTGAIPSWAPGGGVVSPGAYIRKLLGASRRRRSSGTGVVYDHSGHAIHTTFDAVPDRTVVDDTVVVGDTS